MEKPTNEKSLAARLVKTQMELDVELRGPVFAIREEKKACCCFHRCICVSETEFALIYEHISKNWKAEEVQRVIRDSISQRAILKEALPELSETLEGKTTLKELLETGENALPFNCNFYDESAGSCKIFEQRPLLCRAYGAALYPSQLTIDRATSKLISFLLLKGCEKGRVIIRRPVPLLYFFSLVFKGEVPEKITEVSFCNEILNLDEEEYIKKLCEQSGG